ncbi:hypothetical protein L596_009680 [Steinernema carpocapsae]|uniref:RYYR-CCHC domain-containing protein n=1 Tax=Steinernema carpocapsae TaxID=34508 RepID=A0A4U5PGC9_STECR|nr:hypothetical protein L596_009680 [Steinernema carpocapsae]
MRGQPRDDTNNASAASPAALEIASRCLKPETTMASSSALRSSSQPSEIDWEQMSFSKTLNKSLLTVKQPDGAYRIYRLIRGYKETQHFRCSTCDRLNAKKNTRYMPKVRTKSGKLVGDPFPAHHPECVPLSVEEYGLKQIDRFCRWYIKEKHVPPKAAWELGRKYCRQYAEHHGLSEDFVHCFPEFEKIKATYLRIYHHAGGHPTNTADDLSTMTLEPTTIEAESAGFLYAADRDQPEPLNDESLEDLDESELTAHDLRRKMDQLSSVTELPRDPKTGEIILTISYEEMCSRVVCHEANDDVTLFFSKRCRPQITFKGHVYYLFTEKNYTDSDNRRWHCIEPRCTGFITTDQDCSKIIDCSVCHMTSCLADPNKVRIKVAMYDLRLMAEFTTCPLQQLFADFCDKLVYHSPQLVTLLPPLENVTRMLDLHRTQFLIRTRFEFEDLNRRSRKEHEGAVAIKHSFLFSKDRRREKVFPKTVCFHCGEQIGEPLEGASDADKKKSNYARKFAHESLIQHLNQEHEELIDLETCTFPRISHFRAYLKHLASKKNKFIRKGHFVGGTYYLCQCDDRVLSSKVLQNSIPGVHCPAFFKIVDQDDGLKGDEDLVTVEFCLRHMFHDEVESAEPCLSPVEFLGSYEEASIEAKEELEPEEAEEEPAPKRPKRSAAARAPRYRDMVSGFAINGEEELPSTTKAARKMPTRSARKAAKINFALMEQMEEFEANVESLRDRVKFLTNPNEVAHINMKLQELEEEIARKLSAGDQDEDEPINITEMEPGPSRPLPQDAFPGELGPVSPSRITLAPALTPLKSMQAHRMPVVIRPHPVQTMRPITVPGSSVQRVVVRQMADHESRKMMAPGQQVHREIRQKPIGRNV